MKIRLCFSYSDNGGLIRRFDEIPLIADSVRHFYQDSELAYIASSNHPLRAEKGTLYEGGIRVPLLIKWPGVTAPNSSNDRLVSSVDLMPTLARMGNIELEGQVAADGLDIFSERSERTNKERMLFWHYPVYHHDTPASAVRKGNWKLIEKLEAGTLELYDLSQDIAESVNVVEKNPDVRQELYESLVSWRKQLDAAMPVDNPDFLPERRKEWGRHPHWD